MSNNTKTSIFLGIVSILLLWFGWVIARHAGVFIALILVVFMDVGAYWFIDSQVLHYFDAHTISDASAAQLTPIVKLLSEKAGLPIPKIYIIESNTPNAFSIGRTSASASIVVTSGLLTILSQDELTAVIAHELIHIQEGDTWLDSVSATSGDFIMALSSWSAWFGVSKTPLQNQKVVRGFGAVFLAPFAAAIVRILSSHKREFQADKKAAQLCGNKAWLSAALKKLEDNKSDFPAVELHPSSAHLFTIDPLATDKINALFSVQPTVSERIAQLG